jgi:hypothetical protein
MEGAEDLLGYWPILGRHDEDQRKVGDFLSGATKQLFRSVIPGHDSACGCRAEDSVRSGFNEVGGLPARLTESPKGV